MSSDRGRYDAFPHSSPYLPAACVCIAHIRRRSGGGDGWGGQDLASVLSHAGRRALGVGGAGAAAAPPPVVSGGASSVSSIRDDRPIRGRPSGGYDMSFVDMENEWERVQEYAPAEGAWRLLLLLHNEHGVPRALSDPCARSRGHRR